VWVVWANQLHFHSNLSWVELGCDNISIDRRVEDPKMAGSAWVLGIVLLLCDVTCGIPQDESGINIIENKSDNLISTHENQIHNVVQSNSSHHKQNITITKDDKSPLLTLLHTAPHSMSLMINLVDFKQDTMIRLLYERVPLYKGPLMLHLDDPVVEFIPMTRRVQNHTLSELPMGKYIVCGEAMVMGEVYQTSCFETMVDMLNNDSKFV
jgi:hypothetical protein